MILRNLRNLRLRERSEREASSKFYLSPSFSSLHFNSSTSTSQLPKPCTLPLLYRALAGTVECTGCSSSVIKSRTLSPPPSLKFSQHLQRGFPQGLPRSPPGVLPVPRLGSLSLTAVTNEYVPLFFTLFFPCFFSLCSSRIRLTSFRSYVTTYRTPNERDAR